MAYRETFVSQMGILRNNQQHSAHQLPKVNPSGNHHWFHFAAHGCIS
jgi:hypothetical protein